MRIKYSKMYQDAHAPTHNHTGDAGLDFYSLEYALIRSQEHRVVRTGIRVEIPVGHVGLLYPKGKNDHVLGAGVIDTYYDGEILFKVVNYSEFYLRIERGDAIGQMIFVPFVEPEPVEGVLLRNKFHERGEQAGIKRELDTEQFV